ncbi:MAG: hypothetical protein JO288_20390 [Hyphomicrobiales bacterium]|nr:hypothetical protein [Hyphomicrobiales bacterium]
MNKITVAIEDDILDKVRVVAAENKTTVNAMVREFLTEAVKRDYRSEERIAEARKQLLRLMRTSKGRLPPDWKFDREEIHERRSSRRKSSAREY